jgi:integrase
MDLSKNQTLLVETNTSLQRMRERMVVREEKSAETFRRYLDGVKNLQLFMKASSPDALLTVVSESKDLTAVLDSWVASLQKAEKRPNNIKSMIMGVKKFLFSNRVNGVEWSFIGRPKVSVQLRDRIPSTEELRLILSNNTTLRDKALFMTAACSGLRIGTLATLNIGDLTPYENTAFITVRGGKGRKLSEGKEYQSWVTSETYTAIQEYFKTRENLRPISPLFGKISKGQEGISIYPQNVARQWIVLIERVRLLKKIENHRMFDLHVHTLRKFFQTRCKLAGCKTSFVDFWLGHAVSEYLNGSYFRPDLRESYAEYKKAIPSLTIFGADVATTAKMQSEIETLRAKVAIMEASRGSLEKLLLRVEELERKLTKQN